MPRFLRTLTLLALLTVLLGTQSVPPQAPQRLNVLFILADDLGAHDLGCTGNDFIETPHLDGLAAGGTRFTQAYAACPVCSPTRASLLTGKYPARLHITDWIPGRQARQSAAAQDRLRSPEFQQFLPLAETTLAERFKAAGYQTALLGKWHLGADPAYGPARQGFDFVVGSGPGGSPPGYFFPYDKGYTLPDLQAGGREGEHLTDRLSDETVRLLDRYRDRPFFIFLSHYAPHIPLRPRPDLLQKYEQKKAGYPADRFANPHYAALVEGVDEGLGRIIAKLKELNLYENTVIVFTSDNGGLSVPEGPNTPATTNAPLREGKGYLHEGGIRVPLLVRWPGLTRAGTVSEAIVSSQDFVPTFADWLTGRVPGLDGVSFLKTLQTGKPPKRPALFWHYPHYANQGGKPAGAVRAGDWKLIENYEDGQLELYNLKTDPGEVKNVAEAQPGKAQQLRRQLQAWRTSVGAQLNTPNFER
jgi:arylsulfatase A-like enzyme